MTKQDELTSRLKILRSYLNDHRDQMISDLKKIIEIPSPSEYGTGTDQVGDFLISRLNDLPFKFEKRPGGEFGHHLIVECTGPQKPIVLFCGHMDTVFPLGSEWPFKIENGRAHGPGVIDMKSGLITLVDACRALEFSGGIPVGVRILFISDKEMGSTNSKNLLPELANGMDFGIIMEPAQPNGDEINKRKFIKNFEIFVTGREAHAGKSPETGINAILEIAHKIIQAQQLADKTTGTTINTGFVEGGRSP